MPTLATSIFLGRLWGAILTIVALSFFINRRRCGYLISQFAHEGVLILSGILLLVVGLTTILLHNIWTTDWRSLVTLLGWAALLKGISRLWFPEQLNHWIKSVAERSLWWLAPALIIVFLLGLYLIVVTGIAPAAV